MRSLLFGLLDRWKAPAPKPAKIGWMGEWEYAHRGLHSHGTPENSPSAFAAAMARGMGIECDIQRSLDGQAMVFHDHALDRLTDVGGFVRQFTAQQLGEIGLSGSADKIPTLRQVLEQVNGQVPLLIEIKSDPKRRTRISAACLAVLRELEGYVGPHAVMSFDPRIVHWFAENAPLTVRGLVITEGDDKALPGMIRRRLSLWHARPDFLAYDIHDLPSRFAAAQRKRGLPVLTWTVNTPARRARALAHADAPIAEGAGIP